MSSMRIASKDQSTSSAQFFQASTHAIPSDTELHLAVRNAKDNGDDLRNLIATQDEKSLIFMAKTLNNKGELPIDILHRSETLDKTTKIELEWKLLRLTKSHSLKKLSDFIDFNQVLHEYPAPANSDLYKNMQLACVGANETRYVMKSSTTHPDANDLEIEQRATIRKKIHELREKIWAEKAKPANLFFSSQDTYVNLLAELSIKHRSGNCLEFTFVVWHFLHKRNPSLTLNIYSVENGDHVFLVLGEGKDSVVCDAWAGEVYPLTKLSNKLSTHRNLAITDYPVAFNVLPHYNPNYQKIKINENYSFLSRLNTIATHDLRLTGMIAFLSSTIFVSLLTGSETAEEQPSLRY